MDLNPVSLQQEKTVLEWFEWAKLEGYDWADEAIKYCSRPDLTPGNLRNAVDLGLVFNETPRGVEKWMEIHKSLFELKL